jgi:hypothetical protein
MRPFRVRYLAVLLCALAAPTVEAKTLELLRNPTFDYFENGYYVSELFQDGELFARTGIGAVAWGPDGPSPLPHDNAGTFFALASESHESDPLWMYTFFYEGFCEVYDPLVRDDHGMGIIWDWNPAEYYEGQIVGLGTVFTCTQGLSVFTWRPGGESFGNYWNPIDDEGEGYGFDSSVPGVYTYWTSVGPVRSVINVVVRTAPPPIPEPTSVVLLGLGVVGLVARQRRRP